MIRFYEDSHVYLGENDVQYDSVTRVIHSFQADKDWDKIARNYAKKHKRTVEDVLAEWENEKNKSIIRGNDYHKNAENALLASGGVCYGDQVLSVYPCDVTDGVKYRSNLKLQDGVYPELIMWLDSARIAGQADYVEVVDGRINILDYKTNKEIKTKGFVNWDKKEEKLKFPLHSLGDCNFNIYSLQLNTYMYMLLRHNPHLKMGTMEISHVLFDDDGAPSGSIPYPVKDMQSKVKTMISYWVKHR